MTVSFSSCRILFAITLCLWGVMVPLAHSQQSQGMGAQAFLKNAERLQLTSEQQAKISGIVRKTVSEFKRLSQSDRGKPGLAARLDTLRSGARKEALAILSDQQKAIWEQLNKAPSSNPAQTDADEISARSLIIPSIEEMKNPPSPGAFGSSAGITRTQPHPASGESYVILSDHSDPIAVRALEHLANHRNGKVLAVESLGTLYESPKDFAKLQEELRMISPRFVAIAPRADSYRENMHLCMLKLLAGLDEDPELDAFPGYLVASDSEHLAELIERTIQFKPLSPGSIEPASIGTIEDTDSRRYRSYQKAKVMQKLFADQGKESPVIIITTRQSHTKRADFPDLASSAGNIAMLPVSERHTFESLSPEATSALSQNNILYMFGHGTTDRICGTQASAFAEIDFANELVFCGSCLSAMPFQTDRLHPDSRKSGKRFAFHAMDGGAVMILGHMGLCGGFPKVFPMSELVLDGNSIGESYQRLMNALIAGKPIPAYYPAPEKRRLNSRDSANGLLYVLWGDPALVPIQP
jgi:hypothetical protein